LVFGAVGVLQNVAAISCTQIVPLVCELVWLLCWLVVAPVPVPNWPLAVPTNPFVVVDSAFVETLCARTPGEVEASETRTTADIKKRFFIRSTRCRCRAQRLARHRFAPSWSVEHAPDLSPDILLTPLAPGSFAAEDAAHIRFFSRSPRECGAITSLRLCQPRTALPART
jgi:hypothetical protein